MNLLIVNTGSSSVKLHLLGPRDEVLATASLPRLDPDQMKAALERFLDTAPVPGAAGHRIVHGGSRFTEAIVLNEGIDETLRALADLAPQHNPPALGAIEAVADLVPSLTQVACFDTAFHAAMPARAATYAVPAEWRERLGVRRFGFHGLSHAWASRRAAALLGRPPEALRLVTAHLGAGASLAAVEAGRSVDTTMGFTPLEGLVMARRSGTVDPGLVLWVQRHAGWSAAQVEQALEERSGLLGLSERSADLREVVAAARSGDPRSELAYEVFVYRIRTSVGSMAAAMGGLDGLVFTGGAGQASPSLRADVVAGLAFLGLAVEEPGVAGQDAVLSAPGAPAAVVVVQSHEELEIARQVRRLLG